MMLHLFPVNFYNNSKDFPSCLFFLTFQGMDYYLEFYPLPKWLAFLKLIKLEHIQNMVCLMECLWILLCSHFCPNTHKERFEAGQGQFVKNEQGSTHCCTRLSDSLNMTQGDRSIFLGIHLPLSPLSSSVRLLSMEISPIHF